MADDVCIMDDVYASCQHIEFVVEERVDANGNATLYRTQLIPPGVHILFGGRAYNGTKIKMEAL